MISITIHNDDFDSDLFVKVVDLNTAGPVIVLDSQRVLASSDYPQSVQVQEDGNGYGNVEWTAVKANDVTVQKTGNDKPQAGGTVHVTVFGAHVSQSLKDKR